MNYHPDQPDEISAAANRFGAAALICLCCAILYGTWLVRPPEKIGVRYASPHAPVLVVYDTYWIKDTQRFIQNMIFSGHASCTADAASSLTISGGSATYLCKGNNGETTWTVKALK